MRLPMYRVPSWIFLSSMESLITNQLSLFGTELMPLRVVNVSSVPQRSPFRYAGGKTWLVPVVRQWLRSAGCRVLVEPFCGGAAVSLAAVAERMVPRAVMVEKDDDVAAVWETIMSGGEGLVERILSFEMTADNVQSALSQEPASVEERAFHTILRNRTNHGGILAKGSGMIKNGENGKGIASRWYPQTLARRIRKIAVDRARFSFIHGDAFDVPWPGDARGACVFIDPPYTVAGKRLYVCNEVDHEELFRRVAALPCRWLMTYDKCDYILSLAAKHGMAWREIPMQTTHLVQKNELLIGSDFHWMEG